MKYLSGNNSSEIIGLLTYGILYQHVGKFSINNGTNLKLRVNQYTVLFPTSPPSCEFDTHS